MPDLSGPLKLALRLRKSDRRMSAHNVIYMAVCLHYLPTLSSKTFELLRLARNAGKDLEEGLDNLIKPRRGKGRRNANKKRS